MVKVNNLTFAYGRQYPIFREFDLTIDRGRAFSIIGPSGSGKTTLLYLVGGLLKPDSGVIEIGGIPIYRPRPKTGMILQDHGLLPWATLLENASLGFRIRAFYGPDGRHVPMGDPVDEDEAEKRVITWINRLGLEPLKDKYPSQLSRGQRQRTAIARTLSLEPDLLLMDEPFSALDAAIREDLQSSIMEIHRDSSLTTIIVTHSIEEAVFMGDSIMVLKGPRNSQTTLIDNPIAGMNDYQKREEFRPLCEKLRILLDY